jgi:rhamnosyltransferase
VQEHKSAELGLSGGPNSVPKSAEPVVRPLVSVVIPVKNGGPLLVRVVESVLKQAEVNLAEVILIDSGSSDGAIDRVAHHERVRIHRIEPHEFGHGKTRNLGIELSAGEFVAMLTQDALPADRFWLYHLLLPFADPAVAGVFGRHTVHEHHSPSLKAELDGFFHSLLDFGQIVKIDCGDEQFEMNEQYRQRCHFFSDNNACLRRDVWKKIPYRDVNFAEDQLWALDILVAGYSKAFAPSALVHHSHQFGAKELLQRGFDEARAHKELFGYRSAQSGLAALATAHELAKHDVRSATNVGESAHYPSQLVERGAQQLGRVLGQSRLATRLVPLLSREQRIIEGKQ